MTNELSNTMWDSAGAFSRFARVYEDMAEELLSFFVRRTFDVEVARDLMAETFAQAFEHRRRFRGRSDPELSAWLYSIARHQLAHYVRKGIVRRKALQRLGIDVPAMDDEEYHRIVELAGVASLRDTVANAFSALPPEQREALELRVINEHPYRVVAETLGISEDTARARVSRGLRRITDLIDLPKSSEATP